MRKLLTNSVTITYTNYRGVTEDREILPMNIRFGVTPYHPEKQWLLDAHCFARNEKRTFAIKDIANWG